MTLIRSTVSTFHIRDIRYEVLPPKLSDTRRYIKVMASSQKVFVLLKFLPRLWKHYKYEHICLMFTIAI